MHILYDGMIYTTQVAGGISRYFTNIINRLPTAYRPAVTTCQINPLSYPTHPNLQSFFYQRFAFKPGRLAWWLEKEYFQAIESFQGFDLIHPTYYSRLTRRPFARCRLPIVLTVYDMIHELFYPDLANEEVSAKREAIQAAQAIICISEQTKQDLLRFFSISEERITVTHLATEMDIAWSFGSEPVPEQPYYLFVGLRSYHKNFETLLTAFAKVASANSEIMLCVVGFPFSDDEQTRIHQLGLSDRILHYPHLSDRHLAKLYRCSVGLVYPSLYEGFGIPPLEAMCCGTAVIASNISSIPEVVGDAGLLFDPRSVNELAEQMLFVLDHPLQRDRFIQTGRDRAQHFSWEKTAAQTIDVYRSVAV